LSARLTGRPPQTRGQPRRATFLRIASAEAWSFRVASDRRFETSTSTCSSVASSCSPPARSTQAPRRSSTRPISRAVTSARTRLPRSSARRKIVRGWPCEVDAAPPRGRDGEASLERSKRSREEDARARRLFKSRRDCLAAHWLASAPVGSTNDRRRSPLMSCVEQPVKPAICGVSGLVLRAPCLQTGRGRRDNTQVLRPVQRREDGNVFAGDSLWLLKKAPPHVCAWDGALHRPRISRTPVQTTRGRWCLTPEFTGALGAPG
jgi:hypothetical protein